MFGAEPGGKQEPGTPVGFPTRLAESGRFVLSAAALASTVEGNWNGSRAARTGIGTLVNDLPLQTLARSTAAQYSQKILINVS